PDKRKLLEATRFTVDGGGQQVTVTGADLSQAMSNLHESHIPAKLLAIEGPVVPDKQGLNPRFTYMLLFILVMIVLWCGCNNAAKEIVKEEAIYGRERAINLGIVPYLASKFLVLTLITVFQALVLMALIYGSLELLHGLLPGHSVPSPIHCLA